MGISFFSGLQFLPTVRVGRRVSVSPPTGFPETGRVTSLFVGPDGEEWLALVPDGWTGGAEVAFPVAWVSDVLPV